jgi:DNA modification methylase
VNFTDPDGLAGRKNRGRGGKRKLNVEGFTPQSNLGALESHIDSIPNTRENLKRLEQLKALRKVIKRGGTMCIFLGPSIDAFIDAILQREGIIQSEPNVF